ncbi:SDR family NAD(P)-dependent oxidoreductase [Dactylosporangium sp. NPDC048998]|uniref:SDR family NAD(P)-dependent oxidoreductase n=1 Tax=Dactylosporangium sp. NPDC048998 TaxID=3363976 RepID=UPI00371148D9
MPTIAIVGAGPGLGRSIATLFGSHGFQVALISRNPGKLDGLVAELTAAGITTAGFPADVSDHPALTAALQQAAARFGGIDVLEFSPYAGLTRVSPDQVGIDTLRPEIEQLLYGGVTAARAVLPAMLEAGAGILLFTTGGGAINPYPMLATTNAAQAALRNWVHNLHQTLAERGVYAATVAINVFIGATPPAPGIPHADPDHIAHTYWDLHNQRDRPEHVING